jgi:hypothetical protein
MGTILGTLRYTGLRHDGLDLDARRLSVAGYGRQSSDRDRYGEDSGD